MTTRYPGATWLGQTKNNSGPFKPDQPKFLVMHYTAGGDGRASADFLFRPHSPASSAHFVVDRDGSVYQISDLKLITWHAGKSAWRGLTFLNRYSIGIEFANFGYLRKTQDPTRWLIGATEYRSTYRDLPDVFTDDVVVSAHKNGGAEMGWEPYPAAQIRSGVALTAWILGQCPGIREIVGHDDIAPKRKSDPGPAFPMQTFMSVLHPNSEGSQSPDDIDEGASPPAVNTEYIVNADKLNCRGGPGTNFELLDWGPLHRRTSVRLLHEKGDWSFIEFRDPDPAVRGWVFSSYLTPA
ncbi:N-acetylmuramoyl-L-alanine amidase [Methylobacterium gossipiicola]|uniref:N-acetylmuramoyl-L-alanine amidase n=1 Tax=Methylobacterium gossipiicola TaxID=582675 RepID=A0A1I2XNQ3_9HYPH|nr:N-acetylmuramoyl-L-alanine amidase [Methylobacterium gossipiicola]SFH14326.1 N-acetylmuramoyl-L-alanine amidase [Methylobacterium gossipiicola]